MLNKWTGPASQLAFGLDLAADFMVVTGLKFQSFLLPNVSFFLWSFKRYNKQSCAYGKMMATEVNSGKSSPVLNQIYNSPRTVVFYQGPAIHFQGCHGAIAAARWNYPNMSHFPWDTCEVRPESSCNLSDKPHVVRSAASCCSHCQSGSVPTLCMQDNSTWW